MVQNTNDYTVGYAYARRDLSCRYTIGFYDQKPEENKSHELRLSVRRPGLTVLYPDRYSFRSPQEKIVASVTSALLAPEMFDAGIVRAHLFLLRPVTRHTWDGLITLDFPVNLVDGGNKLVRQYSAILRQRSAVVHSFSRKLTINPKKVTGSPSRRFTFCENVQISPGDYTLTVVLGTPEEDRPSATVVKITVPQIPKNNVFLVPPLLGKRADENFVVYGSKQGAADHPSAGSDAKNDVVGSWKSFTPILVHVIEKGRPVVAVTQACALKGKAVEGDEQIVRSLEIEDGGPAGSLSPVALKLDFQGKVGCQALVDFLPVGDLSAGDYVFTARLDPPGRSAHAAPPLRFAVTAPAGVPGAPE